MEPRRPRTIQCLPIFIVVVALSYAKHDGLTFVATPPPDDGTPSVRLRGAATQNSPAPDAGVATTDPKEGPSVGTFVLGLLLGFAAALYTVDLTLTIGLSANTIVLPSWETLWEQYGMLGAMVAIVGLLLRPRWLFELMRLVRSHPTLADGTRMEAWAEPDFPFGNFAQHVSTCPYQAISNMLTTGQKQGGAVIDYRLLSPGVMLTDNDAAVRELLSAPVTIPADRSLGKNLPPYDRLFGQAMFMKSGDDWKRQHRISIRGLSTKVMEDSASLVAEQVKDEFARLELAISGSEEMTDALRSRMRKELGVTTDETDGKIILDPLEFMKNIVMRVLTHVAFGQGMDDADRSTILNCFNFFYEASLSPTIAMPGYVDSQLPGAQTMREAIRDLHQVGSKFIARERAKGGAETNGNAQQTLLSALLNARDEDNGSLSEEEVVHNVFGFMVAGIATTSDSLASDCFLLARHPAVQAKLQGELEGASRWDDIKRMPYLSAVITEQLRLWPPLIGVPPRTMTEDTTLGGLRIPAGTDVAIYGLAMHRRTSHWGEDAEEFRPERFLEGDSDGGSNLIKNPMLPSPLPPGVPDEAFLAFGGGVRPCIARPLAMIEMKLVLMHLLQRFTLVETDPEDFGMQVAFPVVFPKRHLRIELLPRA